MDTSASMDKLEQDLKDALAQVVNDEAVLAAAVEAVKGVLPSQPAEDPGWAAVKAALEANGWSQPVPTV